MRDLRFLDEYRQSVNGHFGDNGRGFFIIPRKSFGFYQVIASNGQGWDHISVCLLDNKGKFVERTPNWDEMCEIKRLFFKTHEQTVEFHPKEEDYINDHPYVLHMWRYNVAEFPLPLQSDYDITQVAHTMLLQKKNGFVKVKVIETENWNRVIVSLLDKYGHPLDRFPKWDEMCAVKQVFFKPDEAAIQIHPSEDIKVDDSNYTLELWQPKNMEMPLPDPILVGKVKKYPAKTDQK